MKKNDDKKIEDMTESPYFDGPPEPDFDESFDEPDESDFEIEPEIEMPVFDDSEGSATNIPENTNNNTEKNDKSDYSNKPDNISNKPYNKSKSKKNHKNNYKKSREQDSKFTLKQRNTDWANTDTDVNKNRNTEQTNISESEYLESYYDDEEDKPEISDRIKKELKEIDEFNESRESLQKLMDERANGKSLNDGADKTYKRKPPRVYGTRRDLGKRPKALRMILLFILIFCCLFYGYKLISHQAVFQDGRIVLTDTAEENPYISIKDVIKKGNKTILRIEIKNPNTELLYTSSSGFSLHQKGQVFAPDGSESKAQDDITSQGIGQNKYAIIMLVFDTPYKEGSVLHCEITSGTRGMSYDIPV